MKIVYVNDLKYGMYIAQNIYRHDSLLTLPKGAKIYKLEKEMIEQNNLEYVLIETRQFAKDNDINFTLGIIEAAYKQTSLWKPAFGQELYEQIRKKIIKNKRVQKYLNELRVQDSYSFIQCINVSIVVALLLNLQNSVDAELTHFVYLSLLHDVGRIKMKRIFNKEEKLTEEEFQELKQHPVYSYQLLKKAGFPEDELKCVVEHHERFDGTGYPFKLKGEDISDLAQIILISDMYNGLSSHRPHRSAFLPHEVLQLLEAEKGKAFGDKYINFFFNKFAPYQIGTVVELSDGSTAVVKYLHPDRKMLPTVDIYSEEMANAVTVHLAKQTDLRIVRIVQSY